MALRWPDRKLLRCRSIELCDIDAEKFWSFVERSTDADCWLWKGIADKYGTFRGMSVHRVAYVLAHGCVPDGLVVGHKCDVKGCVNPAHLEAITHGQNTRDAIARGLRPVNNHVGLRSVSHV